MHDRIATRASLVAAICSALALAACSAPNSGNGTSPPADSAATVPSASTAQPAPTDTSSPMAAPAQASASERLHDLMQQSDFAKAFAAMKGESALPAWVRDGGTATPAGTVQVGAQTWLVAQACKPHDCPSEQVVLLYDKAGQRMQGVFASDPTPGADAGVSANTKWTWLGDPDAATQAWLKQRLTSPASSGE